MIQQLLNCIKALFLRNKDKETFPQCPDFIPDKEDMTFVDPDNYEELSDIAIDAFDRAIKQPYALNNCKTIYEICYNKPAAKKEFNDWDSPECDNVLF